MRKVNRNKLLTLLSSINFLLLLVSGAWYLKGEFKPFESQYIEQRNVVFIETKFKKPYLVWQQEREAECIANARQEPIEDWHSRGWLDAFATDADIMNARINFCEKGVSMVITPRNEVILAYLKHNAIKILIFTLVVAPLSWLFGVLLVYWLPAGVSRFTSWLTTN